MVERLTIASRTALGAAVTALATGMALAAAVAARAAVPLQAAVLVAGVALLGAVLVFVVGRWLLFRDLLGLHQLAAAIDGAELDGSPLYRTLPGPAPLEVEHMVAAWNGFALRFDILMHNLRDSVTTLNAGAQDMVALGPLALRRAGQQGDALQRLCEQVGRLAAAAAAEAVGLTRATQLGEAARQRAAAAVEQLHRVDAELARCEGAARSTQTAAQELDGIALDANLLALHAALEVAQAGNNQRGLGLVVELARALAKRVTALARAAAPDSSPAADADRSRELLAAVREQIASLPDGLGELAAITARLAESAAGRGAEGREIARHADKIRVEALAVAQRTGKLVDAAAAAAKAAAAVEACVWPSPEVDDRDIVAIGSERPAAELGAAAGA